MKKEVYTKDKLIEVIIESSSKTTQYMGQIGEALRDINDNNVLHKQAIDANTKATEQMTKSFDKFFRTIIIMLLAAIIILAGAEKALKFINF